MAALIGVILPDIGAFLLAFVPRPDWVQEGWLRLLMLILALILPLVVGIAGIVLLDPADRPRGLARIGAVLRGYPYAAVLALVLLTMLIVAPIRKVRSILKGWTDEHIAVVVQPGGYDRVATDVEGALDSAGLEIARGRAPFVLELPSRLLAAVGGSSVRRLVPDHLFVLKNQRLEVTLHPSDIAISGKKEDVARARAAIATRVTFTAAYMTTAEESQQVEDVLLAISEGRAPAGAMGAVDDRLARLTIPHDEWEVLYRQRLQVERDLRERQAAARDCWLRIRAVGPGREAPAPAGRLTRADKIVRPHNRPMHLKPFQFLADAGGVMNARALAELARRAEAAGYHGLVVSDHLVDKLAPVPAMAVIAATSDRLRMSAFVFNNDFRHPAVLAQDLASLDVLSDGRLDIGIGAGWRKVEYDGIGMTFDPVPVRSERLAEAVTVLKGLFADRPADL